MKKILDLITDEVTKAFTECGYDAKYAKVTLSNRPDLCEYQCNGAMAAAKDCRRSSGKTCRKPDVCDGRICKTGLPQSEDR